MSLIKYKNQTEYSFYVWINNFPESSHPLDKKRFLEFAKTVCKFNAKKWKNTKYLKERILKEKSNFDPENLEDILIVYKYLVDFYKTPSMPISFVVSDVKLKSGHYLEKGIKNGKFYTKELPLDD
jgi:hypothetical protein